MLACPCTADVVVFRTLYTHKVNYLGRLAKNLERDMPGGVDEKVYQPKLTWGISIGSAPYLTIDLRAPSTMVPVGIVGGYPKGQVSDLSEYPITLTLKDFAGINIATRKISLGIEVADTVITQKRVMVFVTLEGDLVGKELITLPVRSDGPIEIGLSTVQFVPGRPVILAHGDEDPFPLRKRTTDRLTIADNSLLTEPPAPSVTIVARLDKMPPGPARLIVSGEVWATSDNWHFTLEPAMTKILAKRFWC